MRNRLITVIFKLSSFQVPRFHCKEPPNDGDPLLNVESPLAIAVAVLWSQHVESLQHHQGQRALQNIRFFSHVLYWVTNRSIACFHWENNGG